MKKRAICALSSILIAGILNAQALTLEEFMAQNGIVTTVTVYHLTESGSTPNNITSNENVVNIGSLKGEATIAPNGTILNPSTNNIVQPNVSDETTNISSNTEGRFVVKGVELTDEDGIKVNSLQNASGLSKVFVAKKGSTPLPATILVALYDGSQMVDLKLIDIDETQSTNQEIAYTANMSLTDIDENTTLKIMIWDVEETFKPYSTPLSVLYGYSVDMSVVTNQEYTLPIIPNSQAKKFKVTYDNTMLNVKDLCIDTEGNTVSTGVINDKITVDEITGNSFTFTFTSTENIECVNRVVMRAIKTGTTTVQISELAE